jgi:hypothetical protein
MINLFKTFSVVVIFAAVFNGCKDSGNDPEFNTSDISIQNLQPLNVNTDGHYEAWLSVETSLDHGDGAYRTVGKFNVNSSGSLVDLNGNAFTLNLSRISNLNNIEDALITVEPAGDNDTVISGAKILGGAKQVEGSVLKFSLTMGYSHVLGSLTAAISGAAAKYTLFAPTAADTSQYRRGVWFSENNSGTLPGLTLPVIPDTLDWVYQAWVFDVSADTNGRQYNMGRFNRMNQPDSYANCQGIFAAWNVPGNDWLLANCPGGIPDITDLSSGNYRLYVTLEPRLESGQALSRPFYLVLFYGNIPMNFGHNEFRQLTNTVKLPNGLLEITNTAN